jgi:chromate reductase
MYAVNQPEVMLSNAHKHFDEQGKLTDETAKKLIRQLLEELVNWTKRLQGQTTE